MRLVHGAHASPLCGRCAAACGVRYHIQAGCSLTVQPLLLMSMPGNRNEAGLCLKAGWRGVAGLVVHGLMRCGDRFMVQTLHAYVQGLRCKTLCHTHICKVYTRQPWVHAHTCKVSTRQPWVHAHTCKVYIGNLGCMYIHARFPLGTPCVHTCKG
jgi:hypothetical protein